MKHVVLIALAVAGVGTLGATGCQGDGRGDLGEPDPDDGAVATATQAIGAPPVPWEPEQGTHILGGNPDALPMVNNRYIYAASTPAFRTAFHLSISAAADGAYLIADSAGEHHDKLDGWFQGLILTASSGQIKITDVEQSQASDFGITGFATGSPSMRYALSYRASTGPGTFGPWTDYCGGSGNAVALAGYYNAKRIHQLADTISFACPDAIAQKCVFWDYVPGDLGPNDLAWRYHQACTNMGNANYCMTGQSFTREETPIRIVDDPVAYGSEDSDPLGHPSLVVGSPDQWPGDPDTYYIEGGWDENGVICLSRLRWAGLPPDPCPWVLKDPRKTVEGKFCDQWSIDQLFQRGALIVNGSKLMDAALQRWQIGTTGDTVSTIRGFFVDRDGDGMPDAGESIKPFQDPSGSSPYDHYLGTDGMLLRHLPGSLLTTQMQPLYMQNLAGGDRYLGTAGAGTTDPSFEGYSFLDAKPQTTEGKPVTVYPLTQCAWRAGDRDSHLLAPGTTSVCAPLPQPPGSLSYTPTAP